MFTNIDYLSTSEIFEVMSDCATIDQQVAFVTAHQLTTGTVIPCRVTLGWWEQWRLDLRKDIMAAMDNQMNPEHYTA